MTASSSLTKKAPDALERAVAARIITQEQCDAIRALERASKAIPPRRVPVWAELLGYLGAVLAIGGAVVLVAQFWGDMTSWTRLALLGVVASAMWGAGAAIDESSDPALWRLRGFLWLLSSGALAFFAALLGADAFGWSPAPVALATGLVTASQAAALWQLRNRPAQQVAFLAGVIAVTAGLGAWADGAGAVGLGLWGLGALWCWLGWRELVLPHLIATSLGAVLLLVAAGVTTGSWEPVAPIFGLATAAGLLAAGVAFRQFLLTVIGVAGAFVYLPWLAGYFFADTVGVPVVLLVTGLALLLVTLLALRRQEKSVSNA